MQVLPSFISVSRIKNRIYPHPNLKILFVEFNTTVDPNNQCCNDSELYIQNCLIKTLNMNHV